MNDNFQSVPPPPYMEVVEKSAPPMPSGRAAMYSVSQQEQPGEIKYPSANQSIPIAYAVQVAPMNSFSRNPVQCSCPNCRAMIVTRVEQKNGLLTWLLCLFLIIFGCWLGCCLIPFCISDLQNVQHYCPNCNAFIGEYRPL
ncbi:unnamed protein product [Adineta steineri]|uniref:LITAF domain-containing protein n=1 Tax=Adineta steineri TaxID=433720 RepID=A0A814YYM4_9BILA|nr:unnamed protein product [Adineta steineri]CAF1180447.1 unnamed protein product [Adineta steineri]CAF1235403.1 unnamed protein product [Adineta steineri]